MYRLLYEYVIKPQHSVNGEILRTLHYHKLSRSQLLIYFPHILGISNPTSHPFRIGLEVMLAQLSLTYLICLSLPESVSLIQSPRFRMGALDSVGIGVLVRAVAALAILTSAALLLCLCFGFCLLGHSNCDCCGLQKYKLSNLDKV